MPILGTVASGYTQANYSLAQTFSSSGNYTVPSGVNLVAFAGAGAGGGGKGGFSETQRGEWGGAGAAAFIYIDQSVTPGDVIGVTIGSGGTGGGSPTAGGTTEIKLNTNTTLLTVTGGGAGPIFNSNTAPTAGAVNLSNLTQHSLIDGGNSNTPARTPGETGGGGTGSGGGGTATSNITGISSFVGGGGGGSGGYGGNRTNNAFSPGGNGGGPYGGAGGAGGTATANTSAQGSSGASGNGPGGGGGGGGGGGFSNDLGYSRDTGSGGSGASARILVYTK
jgi:hypothetical protein